MKKNYAEAAVYLNAEEIIAVKVNAEFQRLVRQACEEIHRRTGRTVITVDSAGEICSVISNNPD